MSASKDNWSSRRRLRSYFLRSLKRGITLKPEQIEAYARRNKLNIPPQLKKLRDEWVSLARFDRIVHKRSKFATGIIFRMGLIQTDLALMENGREWREANNGNIGFFVGVDTATRKVCALPMRGKSVEDYKEVLGKMITGGYFPKVHRIISDNDRGIASPQVSEALEEQFGIPITYLKLRHKAYLAERTIKEIRWHLSQSLLSTGYNPTDWSGPLSRIVRRMNSKPIENTQFRPAQITSENFSRFLDERLGTDSSFYTNTSSIDGRTFSESSTTSKLWKFSVGDTVLISAKLMPQEMRKRGRKFYKPTKHGAYFEQKYIITAQKLRSALDPNILLPGTNNNNSNRVLNITRSFPSLSFSVQGLSAHEHIIGSEKSQTSEGNLLRERSQANPRIL